MFYFLIVFSSISWLISGVFLIAYSRERQARIENFNACVAHRRKKNKLQVHLGRHAREFSELKDEFEAVRLERDNAIKCLEMVLDKAPEELMRERA